MYWLKATALPSILHRISQILTAEDLRVKIAEEACLKLNSVPAGHKWEPLYIEDKFTETLEVNSDSTFDESILEDDEMESENPVADAVVEVDSELFRNYCNDFLVIFLDNIMVPTMNFQHLYS